MITSKATSTRSPATADNTRAVTGPRTPRGPLRRASVTLALAMGLAGSALMVLAGACAPGRPPVAQPDAPHSRAPYRADDAELYALALDSLLTNQVPGRLLRIMLRDSTTPLASFQPNSWFWTNFLTATDGDSALVRRFIAVNREARSLRNLEDALRGRLASPLDLLSAGEIRRVSEVADSLDRVEPQSPRLSEGFWRAFHRLHPASFGSTRVSAIGMNAEGTRAVLEVQHGCGMLCGEGNIVVLERTDGRWRIVRILMTWVS